MNKKHIIVIVLVIVAIIIGLIPLWEGKTTLQLILSWIRGEKKDEGGESS